MFPMGHAAHRLWVIHVPHCAAFFMTSVSYEAVVTVFQTECELGLMWMTGAAPTAATAVGSLTDTRLQRH